MAAQFNQEEQAASKPIYGFEVDSSSIPPVMGPNEEVPDKKGLGKETAQNAEQDIKTEVGKPLTHKQMLKALLSELKPIDYRQKAGLSEGEPLTAKHYIVITIEEILDVAKKNQWSLCYADGNFYIYNGEYWRQIQKSDLLHFLGEAAERLGMEMYSARYHAIRKDLLKQFHASAYLPVPERKGNDVVVNLQNGTYVITPEMQFLRSFDRNDFLKYQLPFDFDPMATAPQFQQYLNRVLPDSDQQKILSEYMGYVFVRNKTLKLEKALILFGEGANGKSVFFDIITALLGRENVSHFTLNSLTEKNGYFRAQLSDKLVNYASEISPHMASDVFKQLVSGEPVEARQIYREPVTLEEYGRLIFNTNTLPRDTEQTEAFFRRFLILQFAVTIPEAERDPQLAAKIIQQELPGVFNWILDGLRRLLAQGRFTFSAIVEDTLTYYRQQSDSVQLFLNDEGYQVSISRELSLHTMYTEYKVYCTESGYKAVSKKVFSERLRKQGYQLEKSVPIRLRIFYKYA